METIPYTRLVHYIEPEFGSIKNNIYWTSDVLESLTKYKTHTQII